MSEQHARATAARRSVPARHRARRRAFALTILGACAAALLVATLLAPRPGGRAPDAYDGSAEPATSPLARTAAVVPTAAIPTSPPATPPGLPEAELPREPALPLAHVRWLQASVAPADRALLRSVFGIDDVRRLFVPDSAPDDVLRYAAWPRGCERARQRGVRTAACHPVLVRVGLAAPRRPAETWDAFATRVIRGGTRAWPAGARAYYTGLASLDPEARPAFERLVADARRAGFPVRVEETYRSPERQALLLARADGRTATATSVHSYGRAADIVFGDGRLDRVATVRAWVAFRRWVARRAGGTFRLVGTPERTWDWPHVELASTPLGFRSLEALLAAARACRATAASSAAAAAQCTIAPHLPPQLTAAILTGQPLATTRRLPVPHPVRIHAAHATTSRTVRSPARRSPALKSHPSKSHTAAARVRAPAGHAPARHAPARHTPASRPHRRAPRVAHAHVRPALKHHLAR